MASPDVEILNATLAKQRATRDPDADEAAYFNVFVSELLLKNFQPNDDELREGIVDGSLDCGVDAAYVSVNDVLVTQGFKYDYVGSEPRVKLLIVQSKTSSGFSEDALLKLVSYLPRLLHTQRNEKQLYKWCNPKLQAVTKKFIDAYRLLLTSYPQVEVEIYYASKGEQVNDNVRAKESEVRSAVRTRFPSARVAVTFVTARTLVEWSRLDARTDIVLKAQYQPLVTKDGHGYICLVHLEDYREFLSLGDGTINGKLFESNVRDWEGRTPINDEIRETLESPPSGLDFWWLNNGVSIVVNKVMPDGFQLLLNSPHIVNGLQTSSQIYRAAPRENEDRCLLVRIILPPDLQGRDKVIRATNNQHELPPGALRATDPTQRNLEEYLLTHDLFYERRRNYYKNQGKPSAKIVSMHELVAADIAVLRGQPEVARADALSVLSNDDDYFSLYNGVIPLAAHLNSLRLLRICEQSLLGTSLLEIGLIDDFRYHLATVLSLLLTRRERPGADDIARLDLTTLDASRVRDLIPIISERFIQSRGRLIEEMSTDSDVTARILEDARSLFRVRAWDDWPETSTAGYFDRLPLSTRPGRRG
jgi:hypothetical protein